MPHIAGAGELAVFCGAIGGAGIGFLWFNTHPAQVFMGDVGALALGGALGFVALATKTELSLPIIGGLFIIELMSRHHPGRLLQAHQEARVPDGAHPPPLREEGLARVAHRGALLDRLVLFRDRGPAADPQGEVTGRSAMELAGQAGAGGGAGPLGRGGGAAVRPAGRAGAGHRRAGRRRRWPSRWPRCRPRSVPSGASWAATGARASWRPT